MVPTDKKGDTEKVKIRISKEAATQLQNAFKAIQEKYANVIVPDFPLKDLSTHLSKLAKVTLPQTKILNSLSKGIDESILRSQADQLAKMVLPQINLISQQTLSEGLSEQVRNMQEKLGSLNIDRIADTISQLQEQITYNFGHKLILQIENIKQGADFDQTTDEIQSTIIKQVRKNKANLISHDALISIFVSILILIITLYSDSIQESHLSDKISELGRNFKGELEKLYPHKEERKEEEKETSVYYVVQRSVNVRNKPSTKKSIIIDILYPNNKVRLVKSKHRWIYVEYFDYAEGIPKYGWVYKKYLKRQK